MPLVSSTCAQPRDFVHGPHGSIAMTATRLERRILLALAAAALVLMAASVRIVALSGFLIGAALATTVLVVLCRGIRAESRARAAADVTERARSAAEIRALAEALERRARDVEAVNRELETLAYSVSHDLRAPLRHISGYVQLLSRAQEGRLEPESQRYLAVISEAAAQMGELIDDLLAFSRMARINLTSGSVAPREVVDAAIAALEMETRGRDIEWRIHDLPQVEADAALLRVVYANLIGNAVKYSAPREHAVIEIGAEGEDGGRAVLYVRDNGVGFDMAYADRLFGIFQRLHPADEFEGTGIGLATVQRIIARHGGRVWAHAAPGEGATFYFTLAKPA